MPGFHEGTTGASRATGGAATGAATGAVIGLAFGPVGSFLGAIGGTVVGAVTEYRKGAAEGAVADRMEQEKKDPAEVQRYLQRKQGEFAVRKNNVAANAVYHAVDWAESQKDPTVLLDSATSEVHGGRLIETRGTLQGTNSRFHGALHGDHGYIHGQARDYLYSRAQDTA